MKRSDIIFKITAEQHRMSVSLMLSKNVERYVVAARRDAMIAMRSEGLTVVRIAAAMGLSRTTVQEHLSPKRKEHRKAYRARKRREKAPEGAEC